MSAKRKPHSNDTPVNTTGLGDWEKHTKGIGSKLLEKMGYKAGQGLGKNNEGIVEPITIQANKGRLTLGQSGERNIKRPGRKVLKYDDDDEGNSDSSDDARQTEFVAEGGKNLESDEDEDSPLYAAKRLRASNQALINDLIEQLRVEEAKRGLLMKSLQDHSCDLDSHKELVEGYKSISNTINYLETINRNDKLDMQSFWNSLTTNITPTTRCHMIQIFALPILKKTYNILSSLSHPRKIDECELERRLFCDMIDVAREWLKTKCGYSQLIDWYLDWKNTLKDHMTSERVRYFRRKLLDVMFLATIKHERDLNSFKYICYREGDASSRYLGSEGSSRKSHKESEREVEFTPLNFKQLIEQTASDQGFVFRPVEGRSHQSKQIYKLERLNIYIDNKVIFVKKSDQWLPKTLDDLMKLTGL